MATKNLARTVIEGGRRKYCRYEEYEGTVSERQQVRARLHRVKIDPSLAEEVVFDDRWQPFDLEFNDKTRPVERWLEKQVGKPWAEVYSRIRSEFDVRTTAGRHIVYGHILNEIAGSPSRRFRDDLSDYKVDEDGVFRRNYQRPPRHHYFQTKSKRPKPKERSVEELARFFKDGRKVGERSGGVLCWFEPTRVRNSRWIRCTYSLYGTWLGKCDHPEWQHETYTVERRYSKRLSVERHHKKLYWYYRQARDLNSKDIAFWNSLTNDQQKEHRRVDYEEEFRHDHRR